MTNLDDLWPNRKKNRINWKYWPSTPVPENFPEGEVPRVGPHHPELENEATIAWGIAECERAKEHLATLDVLVCYGAQIEWKYDVSDEELDDIVARALEPELADSTRRRDRQLLVFFLNTTRSRLGWLPGNFSLRPGMIQGLQRAGLSGTILNAIFSSEGRWCKMGNQCFTQKDENGRLSSFEACYQYVPEWDKGASFVHLLRTRHQTRYFCINYSSFSRDRFDSYIRRNPKFAYRDFSLDAIVIEDSMKHWRMNIGAHRSQLTVLENKYDDRDIDFDATTRQLHGIARNFAILGQDCGTLASQVAFLCRTYEKYMMHMKDEKNNWEVDNTSDMGETLEALKSQVEHCAQWVRAYGERTNIRINLLFHLVNQRESRTNTQIAISSARIAEQTQRDSASMITIAAVTMFFLPGTFISAVLSTTFFDYGDDTLKVSQKWWILPACAIPLTFAVFAVWIAWRWWVIRKKQIQRSRDKALTGVK